MVSIKEETSELEGLGELNEPVQPVQLITMEPDLPRAFDMLHKITTCRFGRRGWCARRRRNSPDERNITAREWMIELAYELVALPGTRASAGGENDPFMSAGTLATLASAAEEPATTKQQPGVVL